MIDSVPLIPSVLDGAYRLARPRESDVWSETLRASFDTQVQMPADLAELLDQLSHLPA